MARGDDKSEKDYWASEASRTRDQLIKARYSSSDILQANEAAISREEVQKRAHKEHPFLSFIAGFSEAFWDYLGEASVAISAGWVAKRLGSNFDEGLQFTTTTAKRMEQAGRQVPMQTLQSAIKFGVERPNRIPECLLQ